MTAGQDPDDLNRDLSVRRAEVLTQGVDITLPRLPLAFSDRLTRGCIWHAIAGIYELARALAISPQNTCSVRRAARY